MSTLTQDLRFALRSLSKKPTFTIVAILSPALGIGANTAIFSVIDAVLLRPLPYAEPDQLVDLYETLPNAAYNSVAPANFRDWEEQNRVFAGLAGYLSSDVNLQGVSNPERLSAEVASDNLFNLLGATHSAVMRLIVRHAMSLAIAGLAIGTVIALALTRVLASLLYGASATDPATFAGVALLLGIVALVASYVPARRTAAVDPVIALRSE